MPEQFTEAELRALSRYVVKPGAGRPPPPSGGPGRLESAARGFAQGATLNTADEVIGAAEGAYRWATDDADRPLAEHYRKARDESRAANDAAKKANEGSYLAGQVVGGVATAALGGAPATLGKAALVGAGYGAAAGAGDSTADLTKGEVGGVLADAALGGAVGGIAGGAAHGVAKGAGAAARGAASLYGKLPEKVAGIPTFSEGVAKWAARPKTEVVTKLARESAKSGKEVSELGRNTTISKRLAETDELEQRMSERLGQKYRFSPAEASGDPALALKESAAEQMPATMSSAQLAKTERMRNNARYLDAMVEHVAADPARLGKAQTADTFASAVDSHLEGLATAQRETVAPLYARFDALVGGKRVMPTENLRNTAGQFVEEYRTNPALVSHVSKLIDDIDEFGSKTGRLTGNDFQKIRSLWLKRARGDVQPGMASERLAGREKSRIETAILNAFESDIAAAEKGIASKEGVAAFREANQAYREFQEEIERVSTDGILKIAGVAGGEAGDTMTAKLLNMSPEQLGGVFKVANKINPDMASQMRAEMLEEALIRGGKPHRAAPNSAELGIAELKPQTALSTLTKLEPKLQAAFSGDGKAIFALKEAQMVLQRAATGPNLRGSQSAPVAAEVLTQAVETATKGMAPSGPTSGAMRRIVSWVFTDEKATAQALSTREGIETVRDAMKIAFGASAPKKSAKEIMGAVARLGLVPPAADAVVQPTGIKRGAN